MNKKPSFTWALVVGAAFPILQVLIFILRLQNINSESQFSDYLFFLVAGSLIGLGFIYFLRRSDSHSASRGTWIGFIIGIPLALIGMLLGGLMGAFGIIFLSVSPAIFVMGIGYFIGKAIGKK